MKFTRLHYFGIILNLGRKETQRSKKNGIISEFDLTKIIYNPIMKTEKLKEAKNEYLSRKDLCSLFGLSMGSVDKLEIPRIHFGRIVRFRKSDVDAFVKKGGQKC